MRIALLAVALIAARADAQQASGWELRIPERIELTTGTSGTLPITITLDRGRTVSKDAGMTIDLAPDAAVQIKKRRLARTDAVDPEADAPRFAIPVRAETVGDFAVRVRLQFWLCGQKVCRPIEARRSVLVAVSAPTPP
jgi:hypothetical protein